MINVLWCTPSSLWMHSGCPFSSHSAPVRADVWYGVGLHRKCGWTASISIWQAMSRRRPIISLSSSWWWLQILGLDCSPRSPWSCSYSSCSWSDMDTEKKKGKNGKGVAREWHKTTSRKWVRPKKNFFMHADHMHHTSHALWLSGNLKKKNHVTLKTSITWATCRSSQNVI